MTVAENGRPPRPLFRTEAIQAADRKHDGEPMAACGLSFSLYALLALAMAGALLVFLCSAQYTRKARVHGFIEPSAGLVKVRSPATGTVARIHVVDGDRVRQGDPLILIDTDQSNESGGPSRTAVLATLESRRARLVRELDGQTNIDTLAQRERRQQVRALEAEADQLTRELKLQRQRVASASRARERLRKLVKQGHLPAASMDEKDGAWLDRRAQAEAVARELMRVRRESEKLLAQSDRIRLDQANNRSRLERELDGLAQQIAEQQARRSVLVTAPANGTVSGLLARRGQHASAEAPLLTLLPEGAALEATLLIPPRSAGFVKPDQQVRIRYAAFAHQRFGSHGGAIRDVAPTLLMPGESELPFALDEPVYPARVVLEAQQIRAYGADVPLKAGMRLEADVALERRRVYEWLLEPVLGLRGRLWPDLREIDASGASRS